VKCQRCDQTIEKGQLYTHAMRATGGEDINILALADLDIQVHVDCPPPPFDADAAIRSLLETKPDPALAAAWDSMVKGAAEWQAKFDTEFTQKLSDSAVRWRDRPWWRKFLGLKAAGEL
jgi:hypothetical protein